MSAIKLDAFSFGGGVQSTAALVLAAQGKIDCNLFIFANVGDDSEHPDTLAYFRNYAQPYAAAHGIELVELSRQQTIRQAIMSNKNSMIIPARLLSGMPADRRCTQDWKIRQIDKYLRGLGFSKKTKARVGIGFSLDEFGRMKTDNPDAPRVSHYPLIDLRINRHACAEIIGAAGLPIPPKSSCYFCPFHSPAAWARLRNARPDLYADAVEIEKRINAKRQVGGFSAVYMHKYMVPLDVIGHQMQFELDDSDDAECASGVCFV